METGGPAPAGNCFMAIMRGVAGRSPAEGWQPEAALTEDRGAGYGQAGWMQGGDFPPNLLTAAFWGYGIVRLGRAGRITGVLPACAVTRINFDGRKDRARTSSAKEFR
jgi:hypothetical protein